MSKVLFLAGLALITLLPVLGQEKQRRQNFDVQRVADGVYALIRREPASVWFNPNNVFIVGEKDVIVVDANISSEYTREVLAALREITDKPVKYVINTHWHEDHIVGNRVYRDAFPDAQFVGHHSTLTDLPTIGTANRKGSVQNGRGFVGSLESRIEIGENLVGQKITDEERIGYTSDIKLVSSYLAESNNFQIVMPTLLVDERLVIDQGKRKIEILYLGRAHTGADLVVHLPEEKIVITGDLIVHPVPLVGSTSFPLEYGDALRRLKGLNASVLIPGHGPVMKDGKYLDQMIALLDSIKSQSEAAAKRGETLEQMRKSVDLEEFRKVFAGDSQHKSLIFKNYVTIPAVAAAHRQLAERADRPGEKLNGR
jgi:glyoxylase-like metal-dependent hydrolase (beta-lactamase superfamily II)